MPRKPAHTQLISQSRPLANALGSHSAQLATHEVPKLTPFNVINVIRITWQLMERDMVIPIRALLHDP